MANYRELSELEQNGSILTPQQFKAAIREEKQSNASYSPKSLERLLFNTFITGDEETLISGFTEPQLARIENPQLLVPSLKIDPFPDDSTPIHPLKSESLVDKIKECETLYERCIDDCYGYISRRSGEPYFAHIYRCIEEYLNLGFRSLEGIKLIILHDLIEELPGIVKRVAEGKFSELPEHLEDFEGNLEYYEKFVKTLQFPWIKFEKGLLERAKVYVGEKYVEGEDSLVSQDLYSDLICLTNSLGENKVQKIAQITEESPRAFFCKAIDVIENTSDPKNLGTLDVKYWQLFEILKGLGTFYDQHHFGNIMEKEQNIFSTNNAYQNIRERVIGRMAELDVYEKGLSS